jgi:o-succinylbenzoate synthase
MLKLYTYSLPFKSAFKTVDSTFDAREGLVLVFKHEGITAFGEIAPLPGFSRFTLKEIIPIIQLNKKALERALIEDDFDQFTYVLNQIHDIPSIRFGLDTLAHDFKSKKAGISMAEFLFKDTYRTKVETNATLSITDIESNLQQAENFIKNGFQTLKIKVGIDFNKEFELLYRLRDLFPKINIRIDANQAWDFNEAVDNLKSCEKLNIEYCEEPLLKEKNHLLSQLKGKVKINLAADESFRNKMDANQLIVKNAVDTFILKPMMFGSFSEINVTKQLADSHYISVVFTTSLESTIGRTVSAILASGWGANKYAHGLSTGSLFKHDLGKNKEENSSFFRIPEKPGLGIDLNFNRLKEII